MEAVPERQAAPSWPARVASLVRDYRSAPDGVSRNALISSLWPLLTSALDHYLTRHAHRMGPIPTDDRLDVVSEKALDLLRSIDQQMWKPEEQPLGAVAAYVSRVARNGLVDYYRAADRLTRMPEGDGAHEILAQRATEAQTHPALGVERAVFASALEGCVEGLKPKARIVWFFRVFYEMSSRSIADHPEVQSTTNNVDVVLLRCRKQIRDCMQTQGYDPHDLPSGTFGVLWQRFRLDPLASAGE